MQLNSFFQTFDTRVSSKGEFSPFLFLYSQAELFHWELQRELLDAVVHLGADRESVFTLSDLWESLKTAEVKNFIAQWDIKARFGIQIFCIENISRMTLWAQNACLKFFEEPGEWNIVILTSASQSGILETILSRVQIHDMRSWSAAVNFKNTAFYYAMIESRVEKQSHEIIRYFFPGKFEKDEYMTFLSALVEYIQTTGKLSHLLDDIHEDMWGIMKNNLSARYIVDKYIMNLASL